MQWIIGLADGSVAPGRFAQRSYHDLADAGRDADADQDQCEAQAEASQRHEVFTRRHGNSR